MKYIFVLEDDAKLNLQIYEALRKSEPDAEIRLFTSMEEFQKWLAVAVREGRNSLFHGGHRIVEDKKPALAGPEPEDHLLLIVLKDEWMGSRHMALIHKTRDMLIRKNICTQEEPTRIVITAFDNPEFEIKLAEDKIISNVLFKPFDELILQQHLHFALKGHHPASENFVHVVQVKQEVEMTKEVTMEAVGDVGFVTRSPREIQIHKISKYYGEVFRGRGRIHVMGRCVACYPHPEFKDEFQVWFSYLGIPSHQITDIRKSMVLRNEVEYQKGQLQRPITEGKKWFILDNDPERVKKWTDLLHRLTKSEIKTESSFEEFIFSSDPMEADSKQKEKAFTEGPSIRLKQDLQSGLTIGIEPEVQKSKKIFGISWAEFITKKLEDYVHPTSLAEWKSLVTSASPKPTTILFKKGQHRFLLKVLVEPLKKENPHRHFELIEPSQQDKIIWYDQHYNNPNQSFCLVVSSQYTESGHESFWREWIEKAKSQGRSPRIIVLYDKVPDDKVTRQYEWADDIFENNNEPPYIERKLRFLYFGEDKNNKGAAYLNSCKEPIRVANPVEVAEISEAGLVVNYYRQISPGALRHFVLPKTGEESYVEYKTNCNYSAPHPSEKDLFQNHFVFFGITDAFLKRIRVWILDNYVQTKQKESS